VPKTSVAVESTKLWLLCLYQPCSKGRAVTQVWGRQHVLWFSTSLDMTLMPSLVLPEASIASPAQPWLPGTNRCRPLHLNSRLYKWETNVCIQNLKLCQNVNAVSWTQSCIVCSRYARTIRTAYLTAVNTPLLGYKCWKGMPREFVTGDGRHEMPVLRGQQQVMPTDHICLCNSFINGSLLRQVRAKEKASCLAIYYMNLFIASSLS